MNRKVMKTVLINAILIFFPMILIVTLNSNYQNHEAMIKNGLNYPMILIGSSSYFLFLVLFLYIFYIEKEKYNVISLLIGLVQLVILQFPKIISALCYDLFYVLYSQVELMAIMSVSTLLMYVVLLWQYIKNQ